MDMSSGSIAPMMRSSTFLTKERSRIERLSLRLLIVGPGIIMPKDLITARNLMARHL